ncbi:uncharacterized protein LOC100203104 isoform X2 [Hydra vulgaris]|uniref:uncharacterized protein LOC100203104 isoform X2 n=1 Tax=Hydra vulgaris TaxID=6087 RepID=UPI0032EA62C5
MSIIDDQVKQLLRSVLVSAPGVKQSSLEHEYYKITNEVLPWRKYKFPNLFEFLKALEGEITRIEFSEKFADNIIYAVIDRTKYNSKHALKFASKSTSNITGKSPEEIKVWKLSKMKLPESLMHVANQKSLLKDIVFNNRGLQVLNKASDQNAILNQNIVNQNKKQDFSEWILLDQLCLDQTGYFLLSIKTKSGKSFVGREKELLQAFDLHKPSSEILHRNGSALIKFKFYLNAYYAWKRKHCTQFFNELIFVRPFKDHRSKNISYKLMLSKLPEGLKTDTLVPIVAEYGELDSISFKPDCIIVSYQSENASNKAEKNLKLLPVKGVPFSIEVKKIIEKPTSSVLEDTQCVESNSAPKEESSNGLKNISHNDLKSGSNDYPKRETNELKEIICNEENASKKKVNLKFFSNQVCGFDLDYDAMQKMFQDTSQTYPKMSKDLPDLITFTITHPVDSCRFWIILIDEHKTFEKLTEIESKLTEHVSVVDKCINLPQVGDRGCGLYKENNSWYRCWILNTNLELMEIKVFWCDYGNTSVIALEDFRTAFDDAWILPPLATPCKFYGYDVDDNVKERGTLLLSDLMMGIVYMAKVNKTSLYSQPHIVEIDNITSNGSSSNIVDNLLQEKFIKKIFNSDVENNIEDNKNSLLNQDFAKQSVLQSMYEYNKDYLEIGMISEVIDPLLFYIQCEIKVLSEIEVLLQNIPLKRAISFKIGDLLVYANNTTRRRVLIVQINKKVEIFHVDYGFRQQVDASSLFEINQTICDRPYHARPAALALCEGLFFQDAATDFLKRLKGVPIYINFLNESSTGEVSVELFSTDTRKSFTMEMLNAGLIYNDPRKGDLDDLDELKSEKLNKTAISNDNDSNHSCENFFNISTNDSKEKKTEHISDRINECPDISFKRCVSPTYPPPDILLSNKVNSERSIITIRSSDVALGSEKNIDVIKINCITNKLDESDVFSMLEKYEQEKQAYKEMLKSLEILMTTSDTCIYEFYKNKKKTKLQQMARIKKLNERLKEIDLQYKNVTQETHELLCRV